MVVGLQEAERSLGGWYRAGPPESAGVGKTVVGDLTQLAAEGAVARGAGFVVSVDRLGHQLGRAHHTDVPAQCQHVYGLAMTLRQPGVRRVGSSEVVVVIPTQSPFVAVQADLRTCSPKAAQSGPMSASTMVSNGRRGE